MTIFEKDGVLASNTSSHSRLVTSLMPLQMLNESFSARDISSNSTSRTSNLVETAYKACRCDKELVAFSCY
jgi:hypothetical protein